MEILFVSQSAGGDMVVENENKSTELATFGGGCFWCLESVFAGLRGVCGVTSGYAGGTVPNPSYQQVCSGKTSHAEVVQVLFRPDEISYERLLQVFLAIHDPTTLNRQGNDVGSQYRSVIFYHDPVQEEKANAAIAAWAKAGICDIPIVTAVEPFRGFYPAEEYHRDYFARHPEQPYCQVVVAPKLAKFRKQFAELLR